ncbi:RHS repeat-associated core domain-containing protein [Paraburkholderia bannensis]|uniref:RHS repeat-associated core domain-containing protein n=1 Tax=Paraburkholderia bannensis TaxID=765414 RepID=UPI002AB1F032|nr:RHS repeat-associated core domain-containing protein [Paraburkholderia bannensis]
MLKELNCTRYTHDERGNLVGRVEPDGTTWLYRYDAANRLTQARRYAMPPKADEVDRTEPVDGGGLRFIEGSVRPLLEVGFAYDAFGRRTKKKVTRPDGEIERTFFTWDGDVLLMEERFVQPVKHAHVYRRLEWRSAQIVREDPQDAYSLPVAQRLHMLDTHHEWRSASLYLHEPGTFVPLARLDEDLVEAAFLATGTDGRFVQVAARTRHATYFYQNDHLGTPQELVDTSGKVVWLARYKAWGGGKRAPYGKTDPVGTDNRIRFQGQYHDEETGLHYNRHRYYDPDSGRFISKDPIGLAGGVNAFQYAPNPVQWIDPLGLTNTFSSNPDDMTKVLGVDPKIGTTPDGTSRYTWFPNSNTRIRYESHPEGLCPCNKGFNPRHHGEHYHVETKPDGLSWGQAARRGQITKSLPDGYTPGSGTGFTPGENFPGS